MTTAQMIILICWAFFLFFWFANWWNVKPTKESKSGVGIFRLVILLTVALIFLNHFVFKNFLGLPLCQNDVLGCHFHFFLSASPQTIAFQIAEVILSVLGIIIAVFARIKLGRNWSATLDVKREHTLVTTGIYGYIRHPIYAGVVLMLIATLLAFQTYVELVIFICVCALFWFRIRKEEELMTRIFPKEYPKYKKRTKALIPFVY